MRTILRALGVKTPDRIEGPPGYWEPNGLIVERIRAAYLRALESHHADRSPIWAHISGRLSGVHAALLEGGVALRTILADPVSSNLYYGMDMMAADVLKGPIPSQTRLQADFRAAVEQLVAVVGADRMPNPEGGQRLQDAASSKRSTEDLLDRLDAAFPAAVEFPNPFRGEVFAARSERGFISHRSLHALYQAFRLRQVARRDSPSCLEIGGGTGRTAYYAVKWGIPAYTIVDLPMTAVGQACFLMATLGSEQVSLFGEDDAGAVVRLRPPRWLLEGGERFDVALNCDSLTEMSREYAERYIDFVQQRCDAFLSINHEANDFTVRELWPGLLRFPYVMRPGYLEEFTPPVS